MCKNIWTGYVKQECSATVMLHGSPETRRREKEAGESRNRSRVHYRRNMTGRNPLTHVDLEKKKEYLP